MQWLLIGGVLGLIPRIVCWVIVWHLIGVEWHWLPHAIAAWLIGDFVAALCLKILGK